jgi:hypothetical protein
MIAIERVKQFFQKHQEQQMQKNERDAKKAVLDELFNDLYDNKKRVYKLNFVRGLLFGAGSALGGTIVLALIVWTLSLFVNIPLVGELFKDAQNSIEQPTE